MASSPEDWYPKLDPEIQHWLQHHVGDALTEEVLDAVVAAGAEPEGEFTPGKQEAPDRYDLTGDDWDWIAVQPHGH
jgi:alpha-D-ribose 1-methylphosphonate 5-triphosphate synthase subunit PhnH